MMNTFCTTCGTALIDGICPKCTMENAKENKKDEQFKRFFMNPEERLVATLGNTYFQNFLNNGLIQKGFAVISNKRIYFRGTSYGITTDRKGKTKVTHTKQSQTVDIKDVTGTGYEQTSKPHYLLGFILSAVAACTILYIFGISILRILGI